MNDFTSNDEETTDFIGAYIKRGWSPIPLKPNEKAPRDTGWPANIYGRDDFGATDNIGLKLGQASKNLLDVDLDSREAVLLAQVFLPQTAAIFGRPSNPNSHYLYEVDGAEDFRREVYIGPDGYLYLEVRGNGHQTMVPPSVHPEGEQVTWNPFGDAGKLTLTELTTNAGKLAAAAMMTRHWAEWSSRHHMIALSLSGWLLRAGWTPEDVKAFLKPVCDLAGDTDWADKEKAVDSTFAKHEAGEDYVGRPRLVENIGEAITKKLEEWLQVQTKERTHTKDDFFAFLPNHTYINRATGEAWGKSGVNAAVGKVQVGNKSYPAAVWLDENRPVHQRTWGPGYPEVIEDVVMKEGGLQPDKGSRVYNTYIAPEAGNGDATLAEPWIQHVKKLYPDNWQHIISWVAQRVQRPGEKINHGQVLGGAPGIGKDALLEPVAYAVGPWNFGEVAPSVINERFNQFLQNVILRISEARDLGDADRYAFYERTKTLLAAPPATLRIDAKNVQEYRIQNVVGIIFTTNHRTGAMYLPADDRRHYVAWSDVQPSDFDPGYFDRLFNWYATGGLGHVRAYLATYDLSGFNPKTPPPKTDAFWAMVDAERSTEETELADLIDRLDTPDAVTLEALTLAANLHTLHDAWGTLADRKARRRIPHLLKAVGYRPVRNPYAEDGFWRINKKRQAVYARESFPVSQQIAAARRLTEGA